MRVLLLSTLLCGYISATSTGSASSTSSSSSSSSISSISSSVKKKINHNEPCNLNEPWLCKDLEYPYFECHSCINNVCFFTKYAFLKSREFSQKMTHHCNLLPFDCNYFHQIKQCHSRFCPTQTLCNTDDAYEICLFKAILCYDAYCEPDLSALPFDYRLYDLCCNIQDMYIDKKMNLFHNRLFIVLGVITMIIFIVMYQIYSQFKKYSLKKLCNTVVKKLKYLSKYVMKNISVKIIRHNFEYFYNEVCKKCKKLKRNIKYQYKNNKMMWCFLNLFDDWVLKFQDSFIAQITIPFLSFNPNNNNNNNNRHMGSGGVDILLNTEDINVNTLKNHNNNSNNNENSKKKSNCKHHNNHKKKRKIKEKNNHPNKKRKKSKSKRTKHKNKDKDKDKDKQLQLELELKHSLYNEANQHENNSDIIIYHYSEPEPEPDNDDMYMDECDDEDIDDEKDLSDNELSISMVVCPFCDCMNAQYLSYCDQCKKSLNEKDIDKIESHKKVKKNKKNNKKNKHKKKEKDRKCLDYWTCIQCTYHNQGKFITCQMCSLSKYESKFSTKSTKKSKKKKNKSHQHQHSVNKNKNRVILSCAAKQRSVSANSDNVQSKSTNTLKSLNPNAKEFILNSNNSNCNIHHNNNYKNNNNNYKNNHNNYNNNNRYNRYNNYHRYEYEFGSYSNHSPSSRLSVIPRLQIAANPEPDHIDYSPRSGSRHHSNSRNHTYSYAYCQEYNDYSSTHNHHHNHNHHIPPRFHAQSPPLYTQSEGERSERSERCSDINISLITPTSILPPPPPPLSVTVSANALSQIPATDLQKQLSDMEANVQEQLQVLDTLFPAIKPDLTQDIQSMQQSIAMNNI